MNQVKVTIAEKEYALLTKGEPALTQKIAAHDASLANMCIGGQLGDMETDFLPVMAFMASDGSKFITGQTISVDGGVMMVR